MLACFVFPYPSATLHNAAYYCTTLHQAKLRKDAQGYHMQLSCAVLSKETQEMLHQARQSKEGGARLSQAKPNFAMMRLAGYDYLAPYH